MLNTQEELKSMKTEYNFGTILQQIRQ